LSQKVPDGGATGAGNLVAYQSPPRRPRRKEQFTDLLLVVEVGRLELHVAHLLPTTSKPMLDPAPVGRLDEAKRAELDRALRHALDVRY
jgi:hypothetical protein